MGPRLIESLDGIKGSLDNIAWWVALLAATVVTRWLWELIRGN